MVFTKDWRHSTININLSATGRLRRSDPTGQDASQIHVCIFVFYIFYQHITYQFLNLLKIKRYINQQDYKFVDLHFVKSV